MNKKGIIKNSALTVGVLALAFGASLLLQYVLEAHELISAVFVLGVFAVAYFTDGYVYGIISATLSMLAVNFAFAFPFFEFNFTIPENVVSAIIMLSVTLPTCALTTKIKEWEATRADAEREKMRANLLRAVSHDLRTPLTTIYGSATAMIDNYEQLSDWQKKDMLKAITEDSSWLIGMVENLLSVTRLDAGSVKLRLTPTVVDELADSTLAKLAKRYPEISVELSIPDEPLTVPMDAVLIEQVLLNLLENAIKHARGMKTLSLSIIKEDKEAIFSVSDDGDGISDELLPTIFTPLSHAADSSHGMGIGLSVCSTIIKAHGGSISVRKNVPRGTTFSFALATDDSNTEEDVNE